MKPRRRCLFPTQIEREYQRQIRGIAYLIASSYDAALAEVYDQAQAMRSVHMDETTPASGWAALFLRAIERATVNTDKLLTEAFQIVRRFSGRTDKFHKRQFMQMIRATYGVDIFKSEPWLENELAAWEAENIALIKSVGEQAKASMHGTYIRAVKDGRSLRDVKAEVKSLYGVADKRAELIARDQIGKLNGQLTQIRQQAIGVEEYTWESMDDERVRPSHQDYDGKTFKWSEPPPEGHPGQPIRCRCYAAPVLPAFKDIQGVIVSQEHVTKAAKESFYDYAL